MRIWIFLLGFISAPALAEPRHLNLGLVPRSADEAQSTIFLGQDLSYHRLLVDGRPFLQMDSSKGSILVPDPGRYDAPKMEHPVCKSAAGLDQYAVQYVPAAEVEGRVTDGLRSQTALIARIIENSCQRPVRKAKL
jgi:hypothetical protein